MQVQDALDHVNALVYKPKWRISATDHTKRFEGTIQVRIDYPAFNSNRDKAAEGYPEEIMTYATFPLIVGDCDEFGLYLRIIKALIDIDTHEIREFLRLQPTYDAPFHPHRIDGMKRWAERNGLDVTASMAEDLKFGIA
jgi:hypothetical protein